MRRLIYALLAFHLFSISGCSNDGKDWEERFQPKVEAGRPAPDFLFNDMDGKPFRLSEERGKVVIIYFWRVKCDECARSLPTLEGLHRRLKDQGLTVLAVGADSMHSAQAYEVREYIKEKDLTMRVLRDEDGYVAEAFRVLRAPTAYVIDKDGVIASIVEGEADWEAPERAALVESLLGG